MKTLSRMQKEDAVGAVCLLLRYACEHDGVVWLWDLERIHNWKQASSRVYTEHLVYAGVLVKRTAPGYYELSPKALRLLRRLNNGSLQKGEQLMEDIFGPQNSATAKSKHDNADNKGLM